MRNAQFAMRNRDGQCGNNNTLPALCCVPKKPPSAFKIHTLPPITVVTLKPLGSYFGSVEHQSKQNALWPSKQASRQAAIRFYHSSTVITHG